MRTTAEIFADMVPAELALRKAVRSGEDATALAERYSDLCIEYREAGRAEHFAAVVETMSREARDD